MKTWELECTLNGKPVRKVVDPTARLLDTLREEFFLTGTKEGCGKGECGACTIFVDGLPVDSCLMLTIQAQGRRLLTIEGLAPSPPGGGSAHESGLDSVQEMFIQEGGVQCGFCIPGMVMAARALLDENPDPSLDEVRYGLGGNLCRCTGYTKIFRAVLRAAQLERQAAQTTEKR